MDAQIVRDAMLALGRDLARRRKAAGFSSQKKFAPHTGYSRSTIANVETGRQRVTAKFWRRCDEVLRTGGVLLTEHERITGLKAKIRAAVKRAEQAQRATLQRVGASVSTLNASQALFDSPLMIIETRPTVEQDGPGEVKTMDRRSFLTASAAAPFAGMLAVDGRTFVTGEDVQRIRAMLPDLYKLDDQFGGDAVVEVAASWLRRVDDLLNKAAYTEQVGRQLQTAFGELAHITGWLNFDGGRNQHARYHYGEALRAAQLSDDLQLEVTVLASMIMLARYQERPREAVQLAQLAQRRAAGWASPRLRALLAAREAVGWAQLGDSSAHRSTMLHAENLFEPDPRDDDLAWIAFFDTSQLAVNRATADAFLGRHDQATTEMRTAVDSVRPGYTRNAAYCRVRLGVLHLDKGDESAACEAVQPALPLLTAIKSGRARNTFNRLCVKFGHSNSPAARDLLDQVHHLRLADTMT